jgi:tripartite-type tricarboxylate transporter receptor subunit TctC
MAKRRATEDTAMCTQRRAALGLLGATLLLKTAGAWAAGYPSKPITVVVPFAPGGYTDVVARLLAEKMGGLLGQPVIIENRPGAGSTIGTNLVAKAAPDGYTLGLVAISQVIAPRLYKELPYDAMNDFVPVGRLVDAPSVLVVNPALPVKSVADLIALAKAKPRTIGYASSGNGSTQHLIGSLFASMTGTQLNHIPYKGSNQSLVDVIGGQVAISFVSVPNALPHIKAGRLRALAVTTATRTPDLPDVPTLQEAGLKGFDVAGWLGIVAPAKTPPEIVARVQQASAQALSTPDARRALAAAGVNLNLSDGAAFGKLLHSEYDRWGKVIAGAGTKVE